MASRITVCFCFFLLYPSLSSSPNPSLCNSHDSFALLEFKNSFSLNHSASIKCDEFFDDSSYPATIQLKNSSYPKTASWGNDSNCCLWDGVTCDSMSGHVIGLNLSCSWLQGQLHPNSTLFQLSHLQTLNLAFNDFGGSLVSPQFGDFPTLMHLNLSQSYFAGEIPLKFSHLSKLVSLDLSGNELRLEPSIWEKFIQNTTYLLRELVLDYVNMSSTSSLSLPMNLSSSLVYLSLQGTLLQGNLDNNIFHLQNLQKLDLSWNGKLTGQLPNSIGHLKSLKFLSLKECQFSGPIPTSFENLTQLTYLNLASNNFSGELSFLSNLQSLTSLDLSDNYFSGWLPNVFGNLRKLRSFFISENNVEGELPSSLCKLSDLEFLDFSNNKLEGNFPESIFSLINLSSLHLSSNNLSGSVNFQQFSKFQNLETLDLSNNKFLSLNSDNNLSYTIPKLRVLELYSCHVTSFPKFLVLPNLQHLELFDNKLQDLPESILGFVKLSNLFLSSNNLRGSISLHQFSKLQNLETLDLSNNKFLSLSSDNNVNCTIPNLATLDLSSCDIDDFPRLLGSLQNLKVLNLSNNKIHGSIPKWFNNVGNGSLDYLDLSHNNLTSIEHLSMRNLSFLDLSFNLLQGNLPIPSFGVEFFSASNNKFSGHIPSSFCFARSLMILNLSHNKLSGHIPKCLVAFPNLRTVDLQMNNFVGTIPNKFSRCIFLQSLHLNNNQFEGRMPLSLSHCKQLEMLDVGANKIEDKFPNWLEDLPELQVLILRDNKFYGSINSPLTERPFPVLRIFDVSHNHFEGTLPTAYIKGFKGMTNVSANLDYMKYDHEFYYHESIMVTMKSIDLELVRIITIFTAIDLSNNMFDGEIPQVIGELHSLKGLNLSHNKIIGPIPQSIANLTNLEWVDLSTNRLTGKIPLALMNLNFLEVLNLSQNQLIGEIPRGKQLDTFSNESYEGNLGLCGPPLSKSCNQENEGKLPQPISSFDDKFGFGWKPVALGYGCGMVLGVLMGQVVFLIGKPKWLVRIFQARPKKQAKRARQRTRRNQRVN